ncbi:oligoribonuclease [Pseudomonas luteola]
MTNLAWIDIETTGFTELDKQMVYKHKILELGVVVTNKTLDVLGELSLVVHHERCSFDHLLDDVVTEMHQKNGLFAEVEVSTLSLGEAEKHILAMLERHGVAPRSSPLCGNSIALDRMFIEAQMPELNAFLHYRNLDISSLKEFIKLFRPEYEPMKRNNHRALGDIYASIEEARIYKNYLFSDQ